MTTSSHCPPRSRSLMIHIAPNLTFEFAHIDTKEAPPTRNFTSLNPRSHVPMSLYNNNL
jgi:hypothetical protein